MKIANIIALLLVLFHFSAIHAEEILRMATTTSTESTGLLPVLNAPFVKKNNARIDVIAVGSGKALKLGENGDVDVLLVHAPKAEAKFVADGFGVDRTGVMWNDFILVGPKSDPEAIKSAPSVEDALKKISLGKTPFISRGDDSGTHKKELSLWEKAAVKPEGNWYISAGQGMSAVLRMADDKQAYTLTDRGTFLAYQDKAQLVILWEGSTELLNPYHVIAVNPKRNVHIKYALAKEYIDYVTGAEGQAIIGNFKKDGNVLFHPGLPK
ncbi:MAG: tungsten ABC transporter substrate-binding protein [Methyloglobulus sp.]|nr:tungsten ABC transporter substrate-binding protein [Methyloglobulus sp.]